MRPIYVDLSQLRHLRHLCHLRHLRHLRHVIYVIYVIYVSVLILQALYEVVERPAVFLFSDKMTSLDIFDMYLVV